MACESGWRTGQGGAVDGSVTRHLRGGVGHGRTISHHATISLDAIGGLALDAALAIAAIGQCIQLELTHMEQCSANPMPQELSDTRYSSRSCNRLPNIGRCT